MEQMADEKKSGLSRRLVASVFDKSWSLYESALSGSVDSWRMASYNTHAWLRASVFPAMDSAVEMNRTLGRSLGKTLRGDTGWRDLGRETADRLKAAMRYKRLVNTVGKTVYGSATFAGETELARDDIFRLSYLPPQGPEQPLALFHAGGSIPYGDRIFRLTPEYNFFDRFLERGVPVYAMELIGDRYQSDYRGMTVESLVDSIAALSDVAFEHHQGRKMVLEGYCGHGTQALAYLAARPGDADRKFSVFATFVAPVDGRRCLRLADAFEATPSPLLESQLRWWRHVGGYVPGDALRVGLDLALGTVFHKTPMGYFAAGFREADLAHVGDASNLTARQKRELAGSYWISADCARRYPVPIDLTRFTARLFTEGISPTGDMPFTYKGSPLSLSRVVDETGLKLVGIYGGLDEVVLDRTAHILSLLFGERYRHVVHPGAGHISYVLSPKMWDPGHPRGLRPNPVDLLLETADVAPASPSSGE